MPHDLVAVDLSHYQGECDFVTAKRAGLVGVIHKASEGTGYVDPDYHARRKAVLDAGLAFASYHFMRPGKVAEQMAHYLVTAGPRPGERVVLDYEDEALTLDELREAVAVLLQDKGELQVTIYSGHLIKQQLGGAYDSLLAMASLWIAQYTGAAAPDWPKGTWPVWSLWQYSDGTNGGDPKAMAGIASPHDCNAFNGSREACRKWFGPVEVEPEPEVGVVRVTIEAPPGVLVTVNGVEL